MALVDMKMSKKEAKEMTEPSPDDLPAYPWGLSLHLGNDELEKLDITDLKAGDEVSIVCKATVTGSSSSKSLIGESHDSIDLQITEMEIGSAPSSPTKTLYDKG